MAISAKYKPEMSIRPTQPGIICSNYPLPYSNMGNSQMRRIVYFLFGRGVEDDHIITTLWQELLDQLGSLIVLGNRAYRQLKKVVGNTSVRTALNEQLVRAQQYCYRASDMFYDWFLKHYEITGNN